MSSGDFFATLFNFLSRRALPVQWITKKQVFFVARANVEPASTLTASSLVHFTKPRPRAIPQRFSIFAVALRGARRQAVSVCKSWTKGLKSTSRSVTVADRTPKWNFFLAEFAISGVATFKSTAQHYSWERLVSAVKRFHSLRATKRAFSESRKCKSSFVTWRFESKFKWVELWQK